MSRGAVPVPFHFLVAMLSALGLSVYACGGDSGGGAGPSTDAGPGEAEASSPGLDAGPNIPVDSGPTFLTIPGIVAGNAFTCRLTNAGAVHCWGSDLSGALGDGIGTNRGDGKGEMGDALGAIDLGLGRTVTQLATFDSFSCALLDDASVKCFGKAAPGYGDAANRGDQPSVEMGAKLAAISLGTGRTAKSIAVGGGHACAVLDDASLKCWGQNASGQLGLGDVLSRGLAPGQMGDALLAVSLGVGRTATAVALGAAHTCALLDDGTVKCWGQNTSGQLGLGDVVPRGEASGDTPDKLAVIDLGGHTAKQITAGAFHTCAILDDDGVKCWGANAHGELGLGDTNARGDGASEMGAQLPEVSLGTARTAKIIRAGGGLSGSHTCAILDDASIKCWGQNSGGELGLGDTNARGDAANEMGAALPAIDLGSGHTAKSVAVGFATTCAVLDDGSVKCWGQNPDGELGLGDKISRGGAAGQMGAALPTIDLGAVGVVADVVAGAVHACARLPNGKIKCWGLGLEGRIAVGTGTGDEPGEITTTMAPVNLGTGRLARQLCAGTAFACATMDDSSLKCWGDNSRGQLGLGDLDSRGDDTGEMGDTLPAVALGTDRTVQVVSCGANHVCAVLDDKSVRCWGDNSHGQLGLGDAIARGASPKDMGDSLPAVALGTGRTATAIAASGDTTCAVLDDGSLKCWGRNDTGQLGLGDTQDRGSAPAQMGDALQAVSLGMNLSARLLTGGTSGTHRCATVSDQTLKCWGDNTAAALGQGDLASRGATAGTMGDALLAVNLGLDVTAVSIATTDTVTCETDTAGIVRCFGTDPVGLFGAGQVNVVIGKSPSDMGPALPSVDLGPGTPATLIALGGSHACALFPDQTMKCWGGNDGGELGLGDVVSRGGAAGQMGSALPRLALPSP